MLANRRLRLFGGAKPSAGRKNSYVVGRGTIAISQFHFRFDCKSFYLPARRHGTDSQHTEQCATVHQSRVTSRTKRERQAARAGLTTGPEAHRADWGPTASPCLARPRDLRAGGVAVQHGDGCCRCKAWGCGVEKRWRVGSTGSMERRHRTPELNRG